MARILVFLLFAFVVWWAVRVLAGSRRSGDRPAGDAPRPANVTASPAIETVAQCAWCGVHVPVGEAVTLPDGRIYCGEAHRDAARRVGAPVDRDRV